MVLLENFGAEPLGAKLWRSNGHKCVDLIQEEVAQPIMPGIPKFGKESHPERDKGNRDQLFHTF
jgi:hypothetical protein